MSPGVVVPNLSAQFTFMCTPYANLPVPVNNKNHKTPACSLSCAHANVVFPS